MGSDFCALLKCPILSGIDDPRICQIERKRPPEVLDLQSFRESEGYLYDDVHKEAFWAPCADIIPDPLPRPKNLSVEIELCIPENISLVFNWDAILLYYPLRFWQFVEEPMWQKVVLNACLAIANLFHATDGIVTRDESPALINGFFKGFSFDESLALSYGLDREVSTIQKLHKPKLEQDENYCGTGYHGYWRFLSSKTEN